MWQAPSIDGYIQHLSRMHETINGYYCVFDKSHSKFSTLKLLRQHLIKYHNSCESQISEREKNSNIFVDKTNPSIVHPTEDTTGENHRYVDDTDGEKTAENIFDVEKIREEIQRMRLLLTLSWLSKDSISRKAAFDIQKDIGKFVIEPIRKTVELMFRSGMLPDTCKYLLDELLDNFEFISEYKFIQQLKDHNLYEDPFFFTISEELKPAVIDNVQQMVINNDISPIGLCIIYNNFFLFRLLIKSRE